MIIAPCSRNLLPLGTVVTSALAFERGLPASNLFTVDPLQRTRWRGTYRVRTGINDASDFTDGSGAHTATLAAGTYYSAAEFCAELARAHGAVGATPWAAYQEQGAGYRRIELGPTSGTASLQIATGANAATNVLMLLAGFRAADRSSAASHTGDYPGQPRPDLAVPQDGNHCYVDLSAIEGRIAANFSAIVSPISSPGARWTIAGGDGTNPFRASNPFSDAGDDELQTAAGHEAMPYITLRCDDPGGWSVARTECGYWWYGDALDTDEAGTSGRLEWEALSYRGMTTTRYLSSGTLTGNLSVVEVEPRETFEVSFASQPGVGPEQFPALRSLVSDLGINAYAVVAPMWGQSAREAMYCRVQSQPTWTRINVESALSRWSVSFKFERVAVR